MTTRIQPPIALAEATRGKDSGPCAPRPKRQIARRNPVVAGSADGDLASETFPELWLPAS
jgi:hypothetical protein